MCVCVCVTVGGVYRVREHRDRRLQDARAARLSFVGIISSSSSSSTTTTCPLRRDAGAKKAPGLF